MKCLKERLIDKGWEYKYRNYSRYFVEKINIHVRQKPKISVVVISWRVHPITIENLRALESQRNTSDFEVIFIDNGAPEHSFDPLMPYIDTYIRLNTNTGACIARNIGALFAQAPILLFLEDDAIPDQHLIESHILTHQRYSPISVRGVCLPISNNEWNERQNWYYLGVYPHARYCDIEGNASYSASEFFEVGGWNDQLLYGGEGKELAIRILNKYPTLSKQIYSPISIIYHDYAISEQQLEVKRQKQSSSFTILKEKYSDWEKFDSKWGQYIGEYHTLNETLSWQKDKKSQERYLEICQFIKEQHKTAIHNYMDGKVFLNDIDFFQSLSTLKKIAIFGAGFKGRTTFTILKRYGLEIDCFVDNNSSIHYQYLFDKPIVPVTQLTDDYFILIASSWSYQIVNQLVELKWAKNKNFKTIIG